MDDRRVGLLVRVLRRRRRWRQADLAAAADVSQSTISRLERGHVDALSLRILRGVLRALEARGEVDVRWRGGLADQLVDESHALLGTRVTTIIQDLGWQVIPEVTFRHFGERGSIDLFTSHAKAQAVCIIELKSAVYSFEDTQRRLDTKARLASVIARQRLGRRLRSVGMVLVVEESSTNRRRLRAVTALLHAGLRDTSRVVHRWLDRPAGPLRGLWFLSPSPARTGRHARVAPSRVRVSVRPRSPSSRS